MTDGLETSPRWGDPIRCPGCNDENLHQGRVDVFIRKEDAEEGNNTLVIGRMTSMSRDMTENPSPRRDGLTIQFECESCSADPQLAIIQHKGSTFIYWLKRT